MRPAIIVALIATMLVMAGSSAANPASSAPPDRVEIYNRFAGKLCGGMCADEAISVTADGYVTWQLLAPRLSRSQGKDGRPQKFRVPADNAARFIEIMRGVGLVGDRVGPAGCAAGFNHIADAWDWSIRWTSGGVQGGLLSCDPKRQISTAWTSAIKALGMRYGIAGPIDRDVVRLPEQP